MKNPLRGSVTVGGTITLIRRVAQRLIAARRAPQSPIPPPAV